MSQHIDLLDTPLRLTWNISGSNRLSISSLKRCADEIVDAGVFFVLLTGLPQNNPDSCEIINILVSGGCRTSIILSGEAELNIESLSLLNGDIFIDCSPFFVNGFDASGLSTQLDLYRDAGLNPGLSLVPDKDNILLLTYLLDLCLEEDVSVLKLPNTPFGVDSLPKLINRETLKAFEAQWQNVDCPDISKIKLEIHDLFIWKIMSKKSDIARSEYGGCQAANSLAHIDADGCVRPCSSWPESLGSLLDNSFEDIWASRSRYDVVKGIRALPSICMVCDEKLECFGGCRGVALACSEGENSPDVLCPYAE